MTEILVDPTKSPQARRMEFSLEPSKCCKYDYTLFPTTSDIDTFTQSYGLADRLLSEGNQLHVAVSFGNFPPYVLAVNTRP